MPLAIVDYTEYNRLATAAPEIAGLWEMASITGTPTASGEINRSVCATTGQSGYILADSELQEDAWTFLRWFSGAEAQADFGRGIEGQLGAVGRYAPANQKAFDSLPWLASESDLLKGQWSFVMENPEPPGFYYTQRNLNNAFRHVVIDGENAREMLEKYGDEIDRELIRKHEEYLDIEIE
jgi:ABC-type glycerol-3-phosphate transport system substrate-binding protein